MENIETDLAWAGRLLAAGVMAAIVGWEREAAGKRAGLRTHMIVGIASALFVAVSQLAAYGVEGPSGSVRVEPIQIVHAIAVGIGFLGTGVIRESAGTSDAKDTGLTTAASIWGTAAIGIAAGLDHYVLALAATLVFLAVLKIPNAR